MWMWMLSSFLLFEMKWNRRLMDMSLWLAKLSYIWSVLIFIISEYTHPHKESAVEVRLETNRIGMKWNGKVLELACCNIVLVSYFPFSTNGIQLFCFVLYSTFVLFFNWHLCFVLNGIQFGSNGRSEFALSVRLTWKVIFFVSNCFHELVSNSKKQNTHT